MSDIEKWWADDGNNCLLLDNRLNNSSIVFDLGGYDGNLALKIFIKFNCNIFIFEAYKPYYENIKNKFLNNNKIKIFNYAVSNKNGKDNFIISNDGSFLQNTCKLTNNSNNTVIVETKSFFEIYNESGINTIDLLKINVEGSEYDILENIFEHNLTKKIKIFHIQFHSTVFDYENKIKNIRKILSKTHKQDWNYNMVWECWSLIEL
jgi:FkbM family methyltransferase